MSELNTLLLAVIIVMVWIGVDHLSENQQRLCNTIPSCEEVYGIPIEGESRR